MADLHSWACVGDPTALSVIIGAVLGILPVIAVLLAIVWYSLEIIESKTFQRWLQSRKEKHNGCDH